MSSSLTVLDCRMQVKLTYTKLDILVNLRCLSLAKCYSQPRLEAACRRALEAQACSYHSLKSILKRGLDREATTSEPERPGPQHENLRGGDYYHLPSKLLQ
jgi:hypothetical protein